MDKLTRVVNRYSVIQSYRLYGDEVELSEIMNVIRNDGDEGIEQIYED